MNDFQCSKFVYTAQKLLINTHVELKAKFNNMTCQKPIYN